MSDIRVEKPSQDQISDMQTEPTWEKGESTFDWEYDVREVCYLTDGDVTVHTPDGEQVRFGAGDLVTFPQGLQCTWEIHRPVRKHYRLG
mgnify:CR=1 FL=1